MNKTKFFEIASNGNNLIGKPLAMDSMNYHYIAGTNQLAYITDPVDKKNYKEDIDNQLPGNYVYDSIGNLIRDNAEKISSIDWTVYGKIRGQFDFVGTNLRF